MPALSNRYVSTDLQRQAVLKNNRDFEFVFNSFIKKFGYNAYFHWLKERATTSDSTKKKAELKLSCQLPICTMSDHFPDFSLLKKKGEIFDYVSCFPDHFFRALAASCVLYNRREHSQGFLIC